MNESFSRTQQEVWGMIQSLNKSWTTGNDLDGLGKYFHENAVALVGSDRKRIEGKDACVTHWRVSSEKTINSWKEIDPRVQIYGDDEFATASYKFDISFEKDGETISVTSRDSFALVKEGEKWLIVLATV